MGVVVYCSLVRELYERGNFDSRRVYIVFVVYGVGDIDNGFKRVESYSRVERVFKIWE